MPQTWFLFKDLIIINNYKLLSLREIDNKTELGISNNDEYKVDKVEFKKIENQTAKYKINNYC